MHSTLTPYSTLDNEIQGKILNTDILEFIAAKFNLNLAFVQFFIGL